MLTYIAQMTEINQDTIKERFGPARYFSDIGSLVNILVPTLIFGAAIIFLAMLFVGGYKIMMAAGEPDAIASGRNTITFAIIGLVIIMISFLVVRIIGFVLGVDVPI